MSDNNFSGCLSSSVLHILAFLSYLGGAHFELSYSRQSHKHTPTPDHKAKVSLQLRWCFSLNEQQRRREHPFGRAFPPHFQKTISILPHSLCHLPHTDVRMGMTQQGNFFVVLFYLFLDNEKSAEGLAWGWLSQIFAHETHPRPYGSSVGGYLTLMTLWHQKNRAWSLFFRELPWIHTSMQGVWKRRGFFGFVFFLTPLGSRSSFVYFFFFFFGWQVFYLSTAANI